MKVLLSRIIVIGVVLALAACEKKKQPEQAMPPVNELPAMLLTQKDGSIVDAKNLEGKIVLIFFHPDCDHCQREAKEIEEHKDDFIGYKIYFISSDPMPQLVKFEEDYHLGNLPNVTFATTRVEFIMGNYGPIAAPSLFIYSAERRLVKKFIGETKIDQITAAL